MAEISEKITTSFRGYLHEVLDSIRTAYERRKVKKIKRLLWQLEGDSNIVAHARRELRRWHGFGADEMDRRMAQHLQMMLLTFALEKHSGLSAAIALDLFSKLARFEPLSPLTGEPHEWKEVEPGVAQNKRCSHVFMENGVAYDIEGRIFRQPDGICYTNKDSVVNISFPYWPKAEYVDVEDSSEENENGGSA